jgi:capsid assembly protease
MADRLRHVLRALNSPWAITPDGFETVCAIIDRRAAGVRLSDDEIRSIVDESRMEFEARHAAGNGGVSSGAGGRAVAVIPVYGTILPRPVLDVSGGGGCSMTTLMDKVKAADADPTVSHILLDIDSPGGSAFLVPEAAQVIRDCATPITAIANPMCCSAAYYLASQADDFVATPSAMVGSIGVFARHVDFSGQLEQDGVKVTLVSAGDNKTNGNPYEPLSDTARAEIQDSVDGFYEDFVNAVAQGRGMSPQDVLDHFGQGRTFSAAAAFTVGMVDRVATFDDVVAGLLGTPSGGYGQRMSADTDFSMAIEKYAIATVASADKMDLASLKDSPATAEQHDGAAKTVTQADPVNRYDELRRTAPGFGSTGR